LESLDGITMRSLPENGRDSYTHVCFFLENSDKAARFHKVLVEKGVPAIYFKNNLWHYLANWEHLIGRKTVWPGPHPFSGPIYGREITYSSDMLPVTDSILARLVVMPISLQMDEERIRSIVMELQAAAEEAS
jgi:8-amino-3,8-dideoxy-alpha-D-manno-octulosonate transaminase